MIKNKSKIMKEVFKNGNKKLKEYYKKQKDNPSTSELARREKIRKAMKGRKITWSNKISKSVTGKNNGMFGMTGTNHPNFGKQIHTEKSKKRLSDIQKERAKILPWGSYGMQGKKHSLESKRKNRESCIKYIENTKLQGMPLKPRLGRNEKEILDNLEIKLGHKILRQFKIAGYFLDGYIPEIKLAIEVDEEYHKLQEKKDLKRQKEIENLLDCKFSRIWAQIPNYGGRQNE